jgi:hypothetical protein
VVRIACKYSLFTALTYTEARSIKIPDIFLMNPVYFDLKLKIVELLHNDSRIFSFFAIHVNYTPFAFHITTFSL